MEISSDSEEEQNVTPTKKRKLHYEQKYLQLWEKDENYSSWIKKSNKGDYYCYCNVCKCDLKCGGGKRVLTKHAESIKHKNNIKGWCGLSLLTLLVWYFVLVLNYLLAFLIKCKKELGNVNILNVSLFNHQM